MITKVVHGWRVGGLLAYVLGPGRAQEHVRPRVIASWDGRDAAWQPRQVGPRDTDLDVGPLVAAMRAPVLAAGLAERGAEGKRGFVWHLSARVAAGDRVLSDQEWAGVVRELLDGAGVAARGDAGGPRWVAVRHADDHVHVAVALVRQDTGKRFWPSRDYPRLRETARRIEQRLGLASTAPADGTAIRAPVRGELEKAARQGREPARVWLIRQVRAAAVAATDVDGFVAALDVAGVLVRLRRGPSGDVLGYAVARPGDVDAAGAPVWRSGSKLAADLSLPRLQARWDNSREGSLAAGGGAERRVRQATRRVRGTGSRAGEGDAAGIAHATGEILTALAGRDGGLGGAAEVYDRAARPPRGHRIGGAGGVEAGLRRTARQLLRQRRVLRRVGAGDDGSASVALVVALTALVFEIARWHRGQGRAHQAVAARRAAGLLEQWSAPRRAPSAQLVLLEPAAERRDHAPTAPRPRPDRTRA